VRISPGNAAGDVHEVDTISAYEALLQRISPLGLADLHVLINSGSAEFGTLRALWPGTLVLNTGREIETSFCQLENLAEWGVIGATTVGRPVTPTTRR